MSTNLSPAVWADELPLLRRDMLDAGFSQDSCVAAARIVLDVCAYFGVAARPAPVWLTVVNADYLKLMEAGEDAFTAAVVESDALGPQAAKTPGGPWRVDIGHPETPGGLVMGHVAVHIPATDLLIDLSIGQVERPHKEIVDLPMLFSGDPVAADVGYSLPNGAGMLYRSVPEHRYLASPNWKRRGAQGTARHFKQITGASIRRMKRAVT